MHYTIGDMAKMMGTTTSTLRYYDKEGLLPFVERSDGGKRLFQTKDLELLYVIDCLKKAGMSIKDIRTYIELTVKGDETIGMRLELFKKRREIVKRQINELEKTLAFLDYKCWYYETAAEAGSVTVPKSLNANEIPKKYQAVKAMIDDLHSNGKTAF